MERESTQNRRQFRFPFQRAKRIQRAKLDAALMRLTGKPMAVAQKRMGRKRWARYAGFRAQTFPHVEAVYADALCLTGSPEDAADLVVAAYLRAFREYDRFRHRSISGRLRLPETPAWLYRHLHAVFCDGVLVQARPETPTGE